MDLKRGLLGFIIVFFLISLISASFQVGNLSHFIETQYNPSEKISGWVNISLEAESADSLLEDSNGNSMTILNLIKSGEGFEYSCNIKDCASDYAVSGEGRSTMSFSLKPKQREMIGISIKGEIKSINFLGLTINSDAEPSCSSQIGLDILNDQSREYVNKKMNSSEPFCESLLTKGCFNSSYPSEQYSIGKFPYKHCQKLILPSSPGFRIGAWVNNQTGDARNLTMALYNLEMEEVEGAVCRLPTVSGSGNVSCIVNHSLGESYPYFVCIYSDKIGTAKVKGYSDKISGCGFYQESESDPEENAAFDIFAQGLKFDSFGEMVISDSSEDNMGKIKDYIYNQYGSYDCLENNCIIPILIDSQDFQEASIKNVRLEYTTSLGPKTEEKFYSIIKIPSKVSSNFGILSLDSAVFGVSQEYGKELFNLTLNGEEVFSQEVEVKNFPKVTGIYPRNTSSLIPTLFTAIASSGKNITEYSWDFNDSTPIQKTDVNRLAHTYNRSGNYKVKISVVDSEGLNSSGSFDVLVMIRKEEIGAELQKKLAELEGITNQINTFDTFIQKSLNSILEIKELGEKIKFLQREHNLASGEEDYAKIIRNLSTLEIPSSVEITKKSPFLPFFPERQEINLEAIKKAGGGVYPVEKEDEYQEAILGWQTGNVELTLSLEEFSKIIESEPVPLMNRIIVEVKKNDSGKIAYLFVKKMENLEFREKTSEKEANDYFYWILDGSSKKIEFSTSEIIDYEELPIFVSPELSAILLESEEISPFKENLKTRWVAISFSLFVLFLIAVFVYSLLSVWYKRKYEGYLFKNRNDLYNLISYVDASKRKGEREGVMRDRLKKAGWTGEQVSYVLKKYSGRRTGMIELPLTKLIDKLMGGNERTRQLPPSRENFPRRPF